MIKETIKTLHGFYCEDRDHSRHLTILTNRQLFIGADRNEETIQFLKNQFAHFMRNFQPDYTVGDHFHVESVNIYQPLEISVDERED